MTDIIGANGTNSVTWRCVPGEVWGQWFMGLVEIKKRGKFKYIYIYLVQNLQFRIFVNGLGKFLILFRGRVANLNTSASTLLVWLLLRIPRSHHLSVGIARIRLSKPM